MQLENKEVINIEWNSIQLNFMKRTKVILNEIQ